jgi:hypothetical protein
MKTLFLLTAITFAASALTWFFTWAIWIHAPAAWCGQPFSPLVAVDHGFADPLTARRVAWYRRLKVSTLVLFAASAALLWAWHESVT